MSHSNPDKTSDCPITAVYHGITKLVSRYGKRREFKTMSRAFAALADHLKPAVRIIFCDSKMTASYTIGISYPHLANPIAQAFEAALLKIDGGHNGICVRQGNPFDGSKTLCERDPHRENDSERPSRTRAGGN